MKSKFIIIGIIILLIVVAVVYGSSSYNTMVEKQEAVSAQWAQVENVYQRRSNLIPNLVSTVKGYAKHEQQTLTDVIDARARATQITLKAEELTEENIQKFQTAQGDLSAALGRLMMVREAYPDLKANENFMMLQNELTSTEDGIAIERNKFNDIARTYNTYIRSFPNSIFAGVFGFDKKGYFEADKNAHETPKVEF